MRKDESRRQRISRLSAELSQHYKDIGNWLPKDNRLLGVPPLIPGEAFSSWCWRIESHLNVPADIIQSIFGLSGPRFWPDTAGVEIDIGNIAKTIIQPAQSLETLMWPKGSLLGQSEFSCLTTIPLKRRPIYRYCETCLSNDHVPYVRQLWRLACAYVCPIHGSILRDLCPSCQKPVELPSNKRKSDNPSLRECHYCGSDLCHVKTGILPRELQYSMLGRQAELLRLIAVESKLYEMVYCPTGNYVNALTPNVDGVIDIKSESNEFLLFQQLLSSLYGSPKMEVNECGNQLKQYMLSVSMSGHGLEQHMLNIGFDGWRLFGDKASAIAGYLHSRQDLWGGTYWWSIDRSDFLSMKPVFKDSDFESAPRWVSTLGKSSIIVT